MPLPNQLKLLNSVRDFLAEEGKLVFPSSVGPKPAFPHECPPGQKLPRRTPEQEGLSSHMLERFVRQLANTPDTNVHSLLILRNGAVVCEGHFAPYSGDYWHVCHSISKSFVGTAVGMAIDEGLFHTDTPLTEFFSEQMGFLNRMRMKKLTVRHLLTMTSGISFNELSEMLDPDWVKGIFNSLLIHEPGSVFAYNSMNSYLLAALLHRASGESLMDFLRPRLFEPLGFGPVAWETSPEGPEKGGWGMYAMPEDLAKLGQLYLNKGRWNVNGETRQLLSEAWVEEATTRQAGNETEGYGFQMWVNQETGFPVMNGMFGQYIALVPPLNMCIVLTSGCPYRMPESPAYRLIREHFYSIPAPSGPLPANPRAASNLSRTLQSLVFRRPATAEPARPQPALRRPSSRPGWNSRPLRIAPPPAPLEDFLKTTWRFSQNRAGILPLVAQAINNRYSSGVCALRLERTNDGMMLYWEEDEVTHCLPVGLEKPLPGVLRLGDEEYITACEANLRPNEDGETVLCIQICLLEHSSMRVLKLRRRGENLLLCLDEQPQIDAALEVALGRKAGTLADLAMSAPALGGLLKNNDFLHYRVSQLCTPELLGIPS